MRPPWAQRRQARRIAAEAAYQLWFLFATAAQKAEGQGFYFSGELAESTARLAKLVSVYLEARPPWWRRLYGKIRHP